VDPAETDANCPLASPGLGEQWNQIQR
jgi:hypothetical protein